MAGAARGARARAWCTAIALTFSVPAAAQVTETDRAIIDAIERAANQVDSMEVGGVRSAGMADAFVGGGHGSSAVFANPAGILTAPIYEGALGYARHFASGDNALGLALVDAKTNPHVAAGASYALRIGSNDALEDAIRAHNDVIVESNSRIIDHEIRGSLAFPIVEERVALGVGVHYLAHSRGSWTQRIHELSTAEGGTVEREVDRTFRMRDRGITLDAGVVALAAEMLSLGFAVSNLLDKDELPGRTLRGGVGLFLKALHLEAEWRAVTVDDASLQHGTAAGAELTLQQAALRTGVRYEGPDALFVAFGAGLRTEQYGADLAFEQNTSAARDRRLALSVSLFL